MKMLLDRIQKRVLVILRDGHKNTLLQDSAKYNCSEVSRLVGCWIFEDCQYFRVYIFKGEKLLVSELAHDLLIVEHNKYYFVIDPTVWQFFPEEKTILMFKTKKVDQALVFLKSKYGGTWKLSEEMAIKDCDCKEEWIRIIELNLACN
jgi:hypothetical protein